MEEEQVYKNAYLREKAAREKAEILLEDRARELFLAHEKIMTQQEQLIRTEKMASLGQLSAGVAHEINTPIAYSLCNLKTLDEYALVLQALLGNLKKWIFDDNTKDLSFREKIREKWEEEQVEFLLEDITALTSETRAGLEKIKKIVSSLKTFSHSAQEAPALCSLSECIQTALSIASNETKYKCELDLSLDDEIQIMAIKDQIEQVFVNLIANSAQAIEEKGKISIKTLVESDFVKISVSDTGCGIKKENMDKLFTPFFTTKEVGKGLGLGLSIVHGIIEKHNGKISVESRLGKGTTFFILLPAVERERSVTNREEESHGKKPAVGG